MIGKFLGKVVQVEVVLSPLNNKKYGMRKGRRHLPELTSPTCYGNDNQCYSNLVSTGEDRYLHAKSMIQTAIASITSIAALCISQRRNLGLWLLCFYCRVSCSRLSLDHDGMKKLESMLSLRLAADHYSPKRDSLDFLVPFSDIQTVKVRSSLWLLISEG